MEIIPILQSPSELLEKFRNRCLTQKARLRRMWANFVSEFTVKTKKKIFSGFGPIFLPNLGCGSNKKIKQEKKVTTANWTPLNFPDLWTPFHSLLNGLDQLMFT